jgi:hypothetical protein
MACPPKAAENVVDVSQKASKKSEIDACTLQRLEYVSPAPKRRGRGYVPTAGPVQSVKVQNSALVEPPEGWFPGSPPP